MDLIEFSNFLTEHVKNVLDFDADVSLNAVTKNNGVIHYALTIREPGINITPTIYTDDFYSKFIEGEKIEQLARHAIEVYLYYRVKKDVDVEQFTCFEKVKDKIIFKLVNSESNKKLLENAPTEDFLDLKMCFCIYTESEVYGRGCVLIKNDLLNLWNISREELIGLGKKNTVKLLPALVTPLPEMIMEIKRRMNCEKKHSCDSKSFIQIDEDCLKEPVFVMSNNTNIFGASVIAYEGELKKIADELMDDLIIIPSSVHEVIVIPRRYIGMDSEYLSGLIVEVNYTLDPEEVLSNHPYLYSRALGGISVEV